MLELPRRRIHHDIGSAHSTLVFQSVFVLPRFILDGHGHDTFLAIRGPLCHILSLQRSRPGGLIQDGEGRGAKHLISLIRRGA